MENQITPQFCTCLPIGRNSRKGHRWCGPFSAGPVSLCAQCHCFSTRVGCVSGQKHRHIHWRSHLLHWQINQGIIEWINPNLKLWKVQETTRFIALTDAYNLGDLEEYRKSSAKRQNWDKGPVLLIGSIRMTGPAIDWCAHLNKRSKSHLTIYWMKEFSVH